MSIASLGRDLFRFLGRPFTPAAPAHGPPGAVAPSRAALHAMPDDVLVATAAQHREDGCEQDAHFGAEFARRRGGSLSPFLAGRMFRAAVGRHVDAARAVARASHREENERMVGEGV
jgi:hypothetical protein